jgi:hypothetical protein
MIYRSGVFHKTDAKDNCLKHSFPGEWDLL